MEHEEVFNEVLVGGFISLELEVIDLHLLGSPCANLSQIHHIETLIIKISSDIGSPLCMLGPSWQWEVP